MKKLLAVTLIVLLSVCLLWGCGKKEATADAPALYYNLDWNKTLTADESGAYSVNFLLGGDRKTFKVTDEALLERILHQDFLGLTLEGDTITGMTSMWDMPYRRLTQNYYVTSIGGNTAKFNRVSSGAAEELLLELPEGIAIYDATALSTSIGATTELQKNDQASVVADAAGNLHAIYVTERAAVLGAEKIFCEHCQANTNWYQWLSTSSMPTAAGHYILSDNVNMVSAAKMGNVNICLDLNGKTVTQTTYGTQMYVMGSGGTLTIMDTVGGGRMIPASVDASYNENSRYGMIINTMALECTVNIYAGTLDASNCTAQYGCAVNQTAGTLNMYGGEIIGGTAFGTGSTALRIAGTMNMYGGKIVGGKHVNIGYDSINVEGGAAIRCAGIIIMHDGIIEGGESWTNGGVLYLSDAAKLIMKGGCITGGKSAADGGGVYATGSSTVTLSGNAQITGNQGSNLWIDGFAKVFIGDEGLGEDALFGISMTMPGYFLEDAPADMDITKHFVSDDSSKKIAADGSLK